VLRLQSSVRPLEFTPSRAMASSREVVAGSLGCCCPALRASQLLFVEIPTRIKSDPPVAVQSWQGCCWVQWELVGLNSV
jgi:hypothetical protein